MHVIFKLGLDQLSALPIYFADTDPKYQLIGIDIHHIGICIS